MPETFDLDAAFRDLERDIAGVSSPRGAGAAIATARRRRRTTIGGVAAGLALAVGVVAAAQGLVTHGDTVGPADLPSPAPLDATHLTTATAGWTPAWTGKTHQALLSLQRTFGGPCTWEVNGHPGAMTYLGNAAGDVALMSTGQDSSGRGKARNAWRVLAHDMDVCSEATLLTSTDNGPVHIRTYRVTQADQLPPSYTWIVSTGEGVGLLTIMNVDTPPPAATAEAVGRALLAAVQDPASYVDSGSPSEASPFVSETDFPRATRGWDTGWSPTGNGNLARAACLGALPRTTRTSMRLGLGSNGRQELARLGSAAEARHVVTSMAQELRACTSVRYSVVRPLFDARSTLVVASGSQVVWLAQHDATVGVVRVPSAGTAPPEGVTTRVGGLLLAAMDAFGQE